MPEVPDDPDDEVEGAEGVLVLLVLVDGVLELLGDEVLEESPFLVLEYRSEYQPPPFS